MRILKMAVVLSCLLISFTSFSTTKKDTPNIIFILCDDLGYGDVSCLNPESKIQTPHMDELANSGVIFSDAHSSSSVCTPSRYSVLTGRYAWRTSLKRGVLTGYSPALIGEGRETVASMLKKHGYQTASIGKWHLGMSWETTDGKIAEKSGANVNFAKPITNGPTTKGFDYYYGISASMDMAPYCLIENEKIEKPNTVLQRGETNGYGRPGQSIKGRGPEFYLPAFTNKTIEKIGEYSKSEKPFFIYFALNAPHTPVAPNKKYAGKSKAGNYGDFVIEVDDVLGKVMKAIKDNGIEENTLVVFTSDNGPETICYARAKKYNHYSSGELKGVKRDLWEGGHRVPFFVSWPSEIKAGKKKEKTICLADFYATVANIVGHKKGNIEGEDIFSFLPLLHGKNKTTRPYTIHHSAQGNFAIRKGDWVFIDNKSGDANRGRGKAYYETRGYTLVDSEGELFNLKDDLREFKNKYQEKPEIVKEMKAILINSKE